jgi:hypothetical protein
MTDRSIELRSPIRRVPWIPRAAGRVRGNEPSCLLYRFTAGGKPLASTFR